MKRLVARRLLGDPCHKGTIHLQTSMPSPEFEPRPKGTAVSVNNHYTGWMTVPLITFQYHGLTISIKNTSTNNLTIKIKNMYKSKNESRKYQCPYSVRANQLWQVVFSSPYRLEVKHTFFQQNKPYYSIDAIEGFSSILDGLEPSKTSRDTVSFSFTHITENAILTTNLSPKKPSH
ncbi:hypothetical protein TNCV_4315891 [Trichonephila clavipes]|nr:hypothetical protein TNCV_4315891 [Trichonephila clavipes]